MIDYKVASPDIIRTILTGFEQDLVDYIAEYDIVPEYLATHSNARAWVIMWYYIGERSSGKEKRNIITELIKKNELDLYKPNDFMNGNYLIKRVRNQVAHT